MFWQIDSNFIAITINDDKYIVVCTFKSIGIRAHPHDSKCFIMSVLLLICAAFCVVAGESLNNNEYLSNIGYIPKEEQNTVMEPDTGGSNIVEVRVLPDPDCAISVRRMKIGSSR